MSAFRAKRLPFSAQHALHVELFCHDTCVSTEHAKARLTTSWLNIPTCTERGPGLGLGSVFLGPQAQAEATHVQSQAPKVHELGRQERQVFATSEGRRVSSHCSVVEAKTQPELCCVFFLSTLSKQLPRPEPKVSCTFS